jgi:hypothetical protein
MFFHNQNKDGKGLRAEVKASPAARSIFLNGCRGFQTAIKYAKYLPNGRQGIYTTRKSLNGYGEEKKVLSNQYNVNLKRYADIESRK